MRSKFMSLLFLTLNRFQGARSKAMSEWSKAFPRRLIL
jgi:hypothetical protein